MQGRKQLHSMIWEWRQETMGIYLNPGNAGFVSVRAGRYVDKSGLIAVVNERLPLVALWLRLWTGGTKGVGS